MPKPSIARLGKKLDEAERAVSAMMAADRGTYFFSPDSVPFEEYERIMHRRHVAKLEYGEALAERNKAAREKFRNRKAPIRARDAFKLRDTKFAAEDHYDTLAALGPDFYTERELLDANAAFTLADWKFDHAQERYNSEEIAARRRDAADRAANIVRTNYHRKPVEVHL
jgi:hypothetical protein